MTAAGARLAGQRAVVTGGGRGIGAGIARRLAAEGAHVTVADIDLAPARAASSCAPAKTTRAIRCRRPL